jgi:hypothetical protein
VVSQDVEYGKGFVEGGIEEMGWMVGWMECKYSW